MEIKPIAVDYNLGSIKGFDNVNILMRSKDKYLVSFKIEGRYGTKHLIEIKDAIIGGFAFLANEPYIHDNFNFYKTYEECIEVIKKRSVTNLNSDFNKFEIKNHRFLLAFKNN